MIRNVVFDMGQVLIHWAPEMFTGGFGLSSEDEALLSREMFRSEEQEWLRMDEGTLTLKEGMDSICGRLPERLHPCVRAVTEDWWNICLSPMEGMEALIRELKDRGYRIWLLSNAAVTLREYFHRIPGADCFDGLYVSAEHRLLKPDRAIYRSFLDTFSLKGEECFFIDDRAENIRGAALENICGVVFRGSAEALRDELKTQGIL